MCVITRAPNSCFNVNDSCFLCHTHRKPLRVSAFSPENKKADTTSKWISQEETLLGKTREIPVGIMLSAASLF